MLPPKASSVRKSYWVQTLMLARPLIYGALVPHIFERHLVPARIGRNTVLRRHTEIEDSLQHRWCSGVRRKRSGSLSHRSAEGHLSLELINRSVKRDRR